MKARMIKVEVTNEDIQQGVRGSSHSCPVAWALRRKYPNAVDVAVQRKHALIAGLRGHRVYNLDGDTADWISHFDHQGTGEPFTAQIWRHR